LLRCLFGNVVGAIPEARGIDDFWTWIGRNFDRGVTWADLDWVREIWDGPIVVKGKIEGDVSAPSLMVSSSGAVHGKVKVVQMHSQGELSGEFDADVVQLSGVVKDNTIVRAKSLEVKLDGQGSKMQVVFGECVLDVGVEPTKEAALKPPAPANPTAPDPDSEIDGVGVPLGLSAESSVNGSNGSHSQPPLSAKGQGRKSERPKM